MGEGHVNVMLIENVENEIDPMLDPLLDRAIIKKRGTTSTFPTRTWTTIPPSTCS